MTFAGTLRIGEASFQVQRMNVNLQVSETATLTTVCMVDLDEAPLYCTTYTKKFPDRDAMMEGLEEVAREAVQDFRVKFDAEGLVYIEGDQDDDTD